MLPSPPAAAGTRCDDGPSARRVVDQIVAVPVPAGDGSRHLDVDQHQFPARLALPLDRITLAGPGNTKRPA